MRFPASRLFVKVFLSFWGALLLCFVFGYFFLRLIGKWGSNENPELLSVLPMASGTVFALLFGAALAWNLTRPLHLLSKALREAAQARFDIRVLPQLGNRRDEVADLAREFDSMATQLQQAVVQQQRLFHDISHELRSPLARMQAAIGLLEQSPQDAAAMIERIQREVARLNVLIEELLTLHKLENGAARNTRERVDVVELLTAITEDAVFEARARGCTVSLQAPQHFVARVDGELIYRAFENVVRNAVKYTAANTEIEVRANVYERHHSVGPSKSELEVAISDRGPGVPVELCELIFEPFRRIEAPDCSEATTVSGTGLGLAIARHAIAQHGGSIRAMPRPGGGLTVTASLPAQP